MRFPPRKMVWQIFPLFLVILVVSLAFVTYYSTSFFKNYFLKTYEKELEVQAVLLQHYFQNLPISISRADALSNEKTPGVMDSHCKAIGKQTRTRITVILPSGKVVGDSLANITLMDDHSNRPEIKAAFHRKRGMSIRYSATLDQNMMYTALPVVRNNAVAAVVRTSVSISSIDKSIESVRNSILAAMFLSILAAGLAGLYIAKRIVRPIEEMKKGANQFARGDLSTRLPVPETEELASLAVTMNDMARNLDEKIQAVKNRSMELEAIHTSMQEGVIAIDEDEKIITINDAAARIFDLRTTDLKNRDILEVARNVAFQQFIKKALASHDPCEDNIVIKKDTDLILNIHSSHLFDTQKHRMGILIIFHDITRMKKLENMHKDFAANVSHELKTPLTSIKGFIETLQQIHTTGSEAEQEKFLQIIEKNVDRMIDLIDDLLSLSRLERKEGGDIQLVDQSLDTLIHSAVNSLSAAVHKKQMTVNIDCEDDLTATIDPILMEQAIVNIVDNGVKYSVQGDQIDIRAWHEDGCASIEIKDQGCGIPKEHLSRIFNRFYRVDKARSRNEGGTGLGLAIVKHIVQYHKGQIEVESTKHQGTSFLIRIPR